VLSKTKIADPSREKKNAPLQKKGHTGLKRIGNIIYEGGARVPGNEPHTSRKKGGKASLRDRRTNLSEAREENPPEGEEKNTPSFSISRKWGEKVGAVPRATP